VLDEELGELLAAPRRHLRDLLEVLLPRCAGGEEHRNGGGIVGLVPEGVQPADRYVEKVALPPRDHWSPS